METNLLLFRNENGASVPFPNSVSSDEQIMLTTFTYNAQRMAATPTITATIEYPRCLDEDWDNSVYATFNGEKYYIRQIPSSSKSNTSVMYKHDITLYSERFILENIYFTDIEKKTENGVDTLVKKEATSIVYRFDLIEYVERLNWSLEVSELPYRVYIDDSIRNSEKARETKDIFLEHAYLSSAIQEIYNQWEIPFYFEGTNIIAKDCSENITDVTLAYGADESLLSIKKSNANFRKITRISGYGSDKNIPFYYPNWSQKGIIDAIPLSTNSKLTKGMLTITDMKKFDKKMPLNGVVKWVSINETSPIYEGDGKYSKMGLKYKNSTKIVHDFVIPFESVRENNSPIEITFDVTSREIMHPTRLDVQYDYIDANVIAERLYSPLSFDSSYIFNPNIIGDDENFYNVLKSTISLDSTINSYNISAAKDSDGVIYIDRNINVSLTNLGDLPKGKHYLHLKGVFSINDAVAKQEIIGTYKRYRSSGFGSVREDYPASINEEKNVVSLQITNLSFKYPTSNAQDGWYLNDTKKINLADIGISVNGTPDESWNNEGFTQEIVGKIPTAQNLMPSLYRNSIGERKFYNAINYPRSAGSNDQDGASGETLNGLMYENENYKDNGEYYNFETLWTKVNQNEHIQEFSEIFPSITNVTNANGDPIDEILEVAFDENDNNEVDEEGKHIHPYFYVRIPQFNGNNGFNLFDHKIVGEEMQVAMTSGDCAACNFEIMVKTRTSQGNDTYEDVVNPIKLKENGTLVDGDSDKKTAGDFGTEDATQQDSRNNSIWLVLKKDNQTFNEAYPNKLKGVVPKVGDKFVLLNIDMPQEYVLEAEEKLTKEVIKYMSQNNSDKWNFDIDFSRIFLQENVSFYERLDENCKLNVRYNGETYNFYVNNYKYEVKANEALPKITVGLVDTITINRGITQNIIDGVMKAFYQMFEVVDDPQETMKEGYLRKTVSERMPNNISFSKDVNIDGELNANKVTTKEITSTLYGGDEVMGVGFKLEEDENGESTLTVDNVNVRKKLKATEFVIQQIQFQGGIVIQSAAAMECNNVEILENGNFKCYFDTKNGSVSNQFMLDDLARCQRVGYAPKYYWRKVIEVGSDYIVLSNVVGEYEDGSDAPSEGDIIVQMGNTTNTDRQSAIEMNTVGENAPSFIMYSGITTFSLLEKDVTGIVYHQKVIDENGNVTIEAYPELYSYGSMYFGDRNKQENFIQFAPNENGTFEMLINAKTSFKGGTSYLGDALDDLLNGVQGAQNAIDNLEIGGVNLVLGTPNKWKQTKALDVIAVGTSYENATNEASYKRITSVSPIAAQGNIYIKFHESGYEASITQFDANKKYIGDDYWISWTNEKAITLHTNTRYIGVTVRTSNDSYIVPFSIKSAKLQIEQGTQPTSYKPNEADTIEARTNIVKDGMMKAMLDDDYTEITLTTPLKPNTEYVFSIERCNKNTEVEVYDGDFIPFEGMYVLDAKTDKAVYVTLIPKNATSTINIYTYGQNVTLVGLKLAQGNKYIGYETTPNEKDAIMALQSAMKGTTDIFGGLVLTNLIELKNEGGDVTAGINGLDTTQGGVDSALRFWAGAPLGSSSSAPFRVYDDGRVFGTHFYGYESFYYINKNNIASCLDGIYLDLGKLGSRIVLDLTSYNGLIQLPNDEKYLGTEVSILNIGRIKLSFCNQMPDPVYCSIDNMFSSAAVVASEGYYQYDYYWKLCRNTCSQANGDNALFWKFRCMAIPIGSKGFSTTSTSSNETNPTYYDTYYKGGKYYKIVWIREIRIA